MEDLEAPGCESLQEDLEAPGCESLQEDPEAPGCESLQEDLEAPGRESLQEDLEAPGRESLQEDLEEVPGCESLQEDLDHWKTQATKHRRTAEQVQLDLSEFRLMSQDYESELEAELQQTERRNKELQAVNQRLRVELDHYKEKYETQHSDAFRQISALESELSQTSAVRDRLLRYIRELEQANDDLERAKRAAIMSLEDFDQRMNHVIERNVFLENELDEKENLLESVQRLKDEARDLRQELAVQQKHDRKPSLSALATPPLMPPPTPPPTPRARRTEEVGAREEMGAEEMKRLKGPPQASEPNRPTAAAPATSGGAAGVISFSTSARISVLNIMGELLRKVGSLESRLVSCRQYVKGQSHRSAAATALRQDSEEQSNRSVLCLDLKLL